MNLNSNNNNDRRRRKQMVEEQTGLTRAPSLTQLTVAPGEAGCVVQGENDD